MEITVYKRHSNDCDHKADRAYRRCTCRMMLEWSNKGKRYRVSAKTRSWAEAEQRARARMAAAHARTIGEQPNAGEPVSLDLAVEMFTAKKSGKHKETRRKYQHTLDRLKAWAVRQGRHYLADITESDLEKYQASWTLKKNNAKRNEQERLRTFFRYCCASAEIKLPYNPTAQLEHFNVTSDEPEDPYTDKEYKAIVSAVDTCGFKPEVVARVKALISVMRYAGLAIQDASILERKAVTPASIQGRACYSVSVRRSKTHTGVNNVVPKEVGDALLQVANGNPHYVFWDALIANQVFTPGHIVMALDKFISGASASEAAAVRQVTSVDALAVARETIRGNWTAVQKLLLHASPEDGRGIRICVTSYFRSLLVKAETSARAAMAAWAIHQLTSHATFEDGLQLSATAASLYFICDKINAERAT